MSSSSRYCDNTKGKLHNIPLPHFSTQSSEQYVVCGKAQVTILQRGFDFLKLIFDAYFSSQKKYMNLFKIYFQQDKLFWMKESQIYINTDDRSEKSS